MVAKRSKGVWLGTLARRLAIMATEHRADAMRPWGTSSADAPARVAAPVRDPARDCARNDRPAKVRLRSEPLRAVLPLGRLGHVMSGHCGARSHDPHKHAAKPASDRSGAGLGGSDGATARPTTPNPGAPLHRLRETAMPTTTFPSQRHEDAPRLQGPAIGADLSEGLGKVWSRTTCPEGLPPELHQPGKLQRHGVVCGSNMIMPFPTRDGRASRWWSVSSRVRSS